MGWEEAGEVRERLAEYEERASSTFSPVEARRAVIERLLEKEIWTSRSRSEPETLGPAPGVTRFGGGNISREVRLHPVEIEKVKPDRPSGWGGGRSQRKVDRMSAWILRFSDTRVTIGIPRPVTVLSVTTDGKETELEVLELGGEDYPGLRDLVRGQIEKGRPHLILDLSSVERIDSNGVGEIVAVWQHAKNRGGELVLAGLKPRIRDIFEILYLDKVIPIFDSVVEAANHLARSGDEPPGSTDSG